MTQWQWDLRRVNHLARVDAYYGGHARVKHESLQVPQQAYFKPQPPAVVAVDDQRQSKAQQRASRKRKREQVRHEELIAAGKFVPVNEALQRALADVHRELLCDEAGIAALQPVLASCSDSNGIPAQHESHQLSVGSLHSNATDEVQIAHAKDGEGVLLPAQSSFILGDVRKLRSGGVTPAALGQFQLIVMDPPWENKSVARSNKYATFHHTELLKIDVPALADPDECVLGIWVTNRPQYTAFILETLLPQWGFTLHDTWFWLKVCADGDLVTPIESSHRLPFEKMIVAYRCADPEQRRALEKRLGEDPKLLLSIPLRHSWKPPPECFFYESMVTKDARKLELFARELRPRWTSVGNEVRGCGC